VAAVNAAIDAAAWLERFCGPLGDARASELGGGVSNIVTLVEAPGFRAVVKQSLGKLRVEKEWISDRERIFREAAAMRFMAGRIAGGRVPNVLAEDRENFAIAMEAAPAEAAMWKTRLFRGEFDEQPARAAGEMLASMISRTWRDEEAERVFGDTKVFEQLRVHPYYRFTAEQRPEAREYIEWLIACSAARRVSLTHGDWSPKNLLVGSGETWAIDWEVIHFGDPSFDAGFLLNHLLLKSIARPEWKREFAHLAEVFMDNLTAGLPAEGAWIAQGALQHLPALLLARVDGKSPVEYLNDSAREKARALALELMRHPAGSITEVFER
jgi:tRNA A-37 threonylcarbamoyl transferase component Bud32